MTKEIKAQIDYWLKSAEHDLATAESLFKSRHYDWCLFLSHLVLEKTLKAFYVRDNLTFPPKVHRLELLAEKTKLNFSAEETDFLKEVSEFNLETRYPDFKFNFYKLCDKVFAHKYFKRIKEFYKCLLQNIKQ
ncbi:MAG: HEPN domain-containing protein [Candidatus Margulisiibacteriota bacterium]